MLYVLYSVFLVYIAILVVLLRGWNRAVSTGSVKTDRMPTATVVVAVRNEEHTVANLLDDLAAQSYPYMEVIIVDDHSTDRTREVVSEYCVSGHNVRLILSSGTGKKKALTTGIAAAQSELILTTDADCRVEPDWVESATATFGDDNVQLAFGLVRMRANSFFSNIQAVEFASVIGMGVGAFGLGQPIFCNGANLAFRKSAFIQVDGYAGNLDIPSGDDEFLLRKIKSIWPQGVVLLDPANIVTTQANPTFASLINQRLRWAGKWKFAPPGSRIMAVATVMIHISFIAALFAIATGIDLVLLPALWGLKMAVEYYFLLRVCRFLKIKLCSDSFFVLQITYSLYVVSIGILSNFASYRWKERTMPPPAT